MCNIFDIQMVLLLLNWLFKIKKKDKILMIKVIVGFDFFIEKIIC